MFAGLSLLTLIFMLAVGLEGSTFGQERLVQVAERHKLTHEFKKALNKNQPAATDVVTLPEGTRARHTYGLGQHVP